MKTLSLPKVVRTACVLTVCIMCSSADSFSQDIRLSVVRSQKEATLSWPLSTNNFVLESAPSLDAPQWQSSVQMLKMANGQCSATVSLDQGQRYFRLRKVEALPRPGVGGGPPTIGFITAVLRSDCASAPPPPPVGEIAVGSNFVIKTVADGDPLDYPGAQQLVTDADFESLMPIYCALPDDPAACVTNRVQWNLVTYDLGGNPRISGGPLSGPGYHYCPVTNGYVVAEVRGSAASRPPLPPVGQVTIGTDAVIMTIADTDPTDLDNALGLATDEVFESLMQRYCALPRGAGNGQVSGQPQWHVATYAADGTLLLSGCAASGCGVHPCVVTRGFIAAVLRSDCADAPPPPPVGEIAVGSNYVIKTVADADPTDYRGAQQLVTDAVFESLMPLYCGLQADTNTCVTNRVQWNLMTYDAGGNPSISGSPVSGAGFHYCRVTKGFVTAVIGGSPATLPSPPPVNQVAIGTDAVVMTLADADATDLDLAHAMATEAVFESLMQRYCALPRGTEPGQVSGQPQWRVATFDPDGTPRHSSCAASGCDVHPCVVSKGFITAVLRSDCTDAPPPPPVGQTKVGTDFVIRTIADGDPMDYAGAQKIVTDAIFESLMPLYCGLPDVRCVTNRVQWNLMTYDAGGNPRISGGPLSGSDYHTCPPNQ